MALETMNPAAGDTASGAREASLGSWPSDHSTAGKASKATLTGRVLPDGAPLTVTGRVAQTLALLIRVGPEGFTSGEASPLGWARRTSAYVAKLRKLGFPILTTRESIGDAIVGRYTLAGQVEVTGKDGKTE